tara:strand:- start:42 stop:488 length:447 start_codon:yes stop_codon:yes gene_type:complete
MGTRSNIGYENKNKNVNFMYCHYDGYLDHNGRMLLEHYNSEEDAQDLVDNGYASSLQPTVKEINEKRVHFDKPEAYKSLGNYMRNVDTLFIEFIYLWRNNQWWIAWNSSVETPEGFNERIYYHTDFKPLKEELANWDADNPSEKRDFA